MIYLDHAATTKLDPEVLDAMLPYLGDQFGNPSSVYSFAGESRAALDRAREQVASLLGADPREIVFTGGGSEADNLAIKGYAWAHQDKGRHIITCAIEHHAVLHTCQRLEKMGFEVTTLCVDEFGMVHPEQVAEALRDDTILVSIMHANNEVGTVEPIGEIAALCHERGVAFHSDAVQSLGKVAIDTRTLGADMLAFSAHKIYGPKGVGVLYLKKGTRVWPVIDGGSQERGIRSGTENVAGIVGMGRACELLAQRMEADNARILALRERLRQGLADQIRYHIYTGHPQQRLPNIASFCFRYIEGEGHPAEPRRVRHLRLLGLGLHLGQPRPQPLPAGDGPAACHRPRLPAHESGPREHRSGGRPGDRGAPGHRPAPAGDVAALR